MNESEVDLSIVIVTQIEPRRRSMIVRYCGRASRAISSAGERFVHTEEVTGSIPVSPTGITAGQSPHFQDHNHSGP
jgi:hypothetical protein